MGEIHKVYIEVNHDDWPIDDWRRLPMAFDPGGSAAEAIESMRDQFPSYVFRTVSVNRDGTPYRWKDDSQ